MYIWNCIFLAVHLEKESMKSSAFKRLETSLFILKSDSTGRRAFDKF